MPISSDSISKFISIRKNLLKRISTILIIKITGIALEFATHLSIARYLGIQHYGTFIYAFTWIALLAPLSALGFDAAAIRFIPQYSAHSHYGALRGFILYSFKKVTFTSLLLASVTVIASLIIFQSGQKPFLKASLLLGAPLVPLLAWARLRQGLLRGFKYPVLAELPDIVIRPLIILTLILIAVLLGWPAHTADNIMLAFMIAVATSSLFGFYWISQQLTLSTKNATSEYTDVHIWKKVCLSLLAIAGTQIIYGQTDILMIGSMLDTTAAGIYAASARLAGFIGFGLIAVNTLVAPMASELYTKKDLKQLQSLLTFTVRLAFAFALIVGIFISSLATILLGLFGDEFVGGRFALYILLVGNLSSVAAGSVGFLSISTGYHFQAAIIMALGAIMNILLNAILIPILGIEGGAIATAISTFTWNLLLLRLVHSRLGLWPCIK